MSEDFVFFIVPAGIMALGLFFLFSARKPSGNFIEVEATIIRHTTEKTMLDCDHSHPNMSTTRCAYPVYEYTIDGNTYETTGPISITYFTVQKYQIGNKETIKIRTDDPKRIHTDGERNGLASVGIFLVAFALFCMYLTWF